MTEMVNPYAAPRAEVADVYDGEARVQPVKLWSSKGRIGRVRFLAYMLYSYVLCVLAAGVLGGIIGAAGMGSSTGIAVVTVIALIPYFVFYVLAAIQRSHDMDWSGWMLFLGLIPLVGLIWIFKSGTQGRNRFGAPPPPNGIGVIIGAWLLPAIAAIGILAAIALPAYQQYTVKAKAAQAAKP
jgi:uncharacterized membrane protein YhaH (DUF805 family)